MMMNSYLEMKISLIVLHLDIGVPVIVVQDIDKHITVTAGAPFGESPSSDHLTVWVLSTFGETLGLGIGEEYDLAYFFSESAEPADTEEESRP